MVLFRACDKCGTVWYAKVHISRQRQNTLSSFSLCFQLTSLDIPQQQVQRDKFKEVWLMRVCGGVCLTWWAGGLATRVRCYRMEFPQLVAITLKSFFFPFSSSSYISFDSCSIFYFFVYIHKTVSWDRVVSLFPRRTQADGRGQRWISWFNCCCAGWFPHVPHTWSRAGMQTGSQLSHTNFSACRDRYKNTDKAETQT